MTKDHMNDHTNAAGQEAQVLRKHQALRPVGVCVLALAF